MNLQDFTIEKNQMLKDGYSKDQVKREIWAYVLKQYNDTYTIEAMVGLSMEIYAEAMVRYGTGM